jgi:hypothetical protein
MDFAAWSELVRNTEVIVTVDIGVPSDIPPFQNRR